MHSGTGFLAFCFTVMLSLASAAQAATYNVTLTDGPDQPGTGDYTLAGAIAAANLDDEPAEVLIHIPISVLYAPLELTNTVTIAAASADVTAVVYALEGVETAIVVGAEASGSRLEDVYLVYDGPVAEGAGIELCDTELTIEGGLIQGFGKALDLQCGAVDLTVEGALFLINEIVLSGQLGSTAILNFTNIDVRGAFAELQAAECGGRLELDGIRSNLYGQVNDIPANSVITLAGCIDMQVRNGVFRMASAFLQANPLPSVDDSLAPVVLLEQVMVYDYAAGDQPLIQFDGDLLALRHSTVTRNESSAGNCATVAGEIRLYHSVIADNSCQSIALTGSADLQYSLVDIEWLGGSVGRDVTSLALLGEAARLEGQPPAPAPDSPLRDAGDLALVPGVGDTPLTDLRGSARLTGNALDIGAIEFNRLPAFDDKAFLAHRRQTLRGLDDDEFVALNLRDYIIDPDGHTFEMGLASACGYAKFAGELACFELRGSLFYNSDTGQILSTAGILRRRIELGVLVEDELGLYGGIFVEIPREGGGDGGGSAAGLLTLLLLLGRRRHAL
ncbi:choice-of-anchor Q domain-containing protein [Alcanivorax sp. 1008]|uniref:choice-of-anchor Q domain-containing protein n=1 Tax=Alcanivorax sp. 1008 TaxID=2816853 RepID=UPI001E0BDB5F|nr:choice-of-anchor Q domain-containing protein [Alcanivorax sp. 1008]MCC1496141.1 hypothetical protein [Alcanivorax sp. 1008]